MNTIQTDVLVVGGGGAACRAALEAGMAGADTILAVKGAFASIGVRGSGSSAGGVSDRGGPSFRDWPESRASTPAALPFGSNRISKIFFNWAWV